MAYKGSGNFFGNYFMWLIGFLLIQLDLLVGCTFGVVGLWGAGIDGALDLVYEFSPHAMWKEFSFYKPMKRTNYFSGLYTEPAMKEDPNY